MNKNFASVLNVLIVEYSQDQHFRSYSGILTLAGFSNGSNNRVNIMAEMMWCGFMMKGSIILLGTYELLLPS